MATREAGTIKAIIPPRGFGFISRTGQADLFFHIRDCELDDFDFDERLVEMRVDFEVVRHNGKDRAVRVRKAAV